MKRPRDPFRPAGLVWRNGTVVCGLCDAPGHVERDLRYWRSSRLHGLVHTWCLRELAGRFRRFRRFRSGLASRRDARGRFARGHLVESRSAHASAGCITMHSGGVQLDISSLMESLPELPATTQVVVAVDLVAPAAADTPEMHGYAIAQRHGNGPGPVHNHASGPPSRRGSARYRAPGEGTGPGWLRDLLPAVLELAPPRAPGLHFVSHPELGTGRVLELRERAALVRWHDGPAASSLPWTERWTSLREIRPA